MNEPFGRYIQCIYLGSSKDMAHNKFDAYKVDDEIRIVYKDSIMSEKIETLKNDQENYMWTPFALYI